MPCGIAQHRDIFFRVKGVGADVLCEQVGIGDVVVINGSGYDTRGPEFNVARFCCADGPSGKPAPLAEIQSVGYTTMSVSIAPGVSTLAFWVAQQILDGKEVPKDLTVPFLRIDQDNLEANLANTQKGGVANVEYSQEDAIKVIEGAK